MIIGDPAAQWIFGAISQWSADIGLGPIPDIQTRASQMRVLIMGVVIVLTLRFAPRGLLPEVVKRDA